RGFNAWRYGTEPIHQAQLVSPGTPVSDSFQVTDENWYYVNVPANGAIITAYTEGTIDTVITVYDANGTALEEDDDSGNDYNARITVVSAGGMLYVKVKAYYGGQGTTTYQFYTVVEAL
ncbi:MAG: PPC domain-containing protein, partial [Treponema sp.]|nr:PPC domain-containing protein [Treponema sp.]